MMVFDLSLSEARKLAREVDGTYRKTGESRFDGESRQWIDEPSYCVMDWHTYYIWKNQK